MALREVHVRRVAGLHVSEWPGDGGPVLGLPGLGSTGRSWSPVAEALADARVVAPDLRGRGGSAGLGGPTGLRHHALDVAKVADELDLRDIVLVGHSMGAYLALVVAEELRDRVSRLVLVDGGIPPKLPFFLRPAVTRIVFRRQLAKGDRPWADAETFTRELSGKMLANRPDLVEQVTAWAAADLTGPPGALRPRLDIPHVAEDAVDTFFGPDVVPALEGLTVPAHLLAATHGTHDRAKPFLADEVIAGWTTRIPLLTSERVEANHLTILFSPELAAAVSG
jgi:pimeloyl-ACP methyl ester carboxylesterase